jgi:hypothetical protein
VPRAGIQTPRCLHGGPRMPCELRRHIRRTSRPGERTD